jgi:hypothetical protein
MAPCTGEIDSLGNARTFRDHVWRNHGLPEQLISDRGTQFVSGMTRELNKLIGVNLTPSTAFHPQTDGQTERVNQEIEAFLRIFVNERQDDWADWLPLAEFAYNNAVHASTRASPFQLDTGRNPRMGFEPPRDTHYEEAGAFASTLLKATEEAKSALKQAATDMKRYYDRKHADPPAFKVGDKVWLSSKNIKTRRPAKKLDDKWFGPYAIDKVISPLVYRLALPRSLNRIHPVFHVSLLRAAPRDDIQERPQNAHPDPELDDDGREVYEVQQILNSRLFRRKHLQYLVKWVGYGNEENSWEPAANVAESADLIEEFHRDHPTAPRLESRE